MPLKLSSVGTVSSALIWMSVIIFELKTETERPGTRKYMRYMHFSEELFC